MRLTDIDRHDTDILILGTGGAGLFAALHAQQTAPEGTKITAEVIHIDSHDRKISLSERGASERSAGDIEGYMNAQNDSSARLGDVMGDLSSKFRNDD